MNRETQLKHLDEFTSKMKEVIMSKGDDYAGADRLSAFKKAAALANLTPLQSCLNQIAIKAVRLGELISGKEPNHESILDSMLDGDAYFANLYCLIKEETEISQ